MKANEALEKIYLPIDDSLKTYARKDSNEEIEYTRADAFIEKACAWFRTLDDKEPPYETTKEFIEGFKKAMKGE